MDQQIFEYVSGLFDRLLANTETWLSQHGFEIFVILLTAYFIKRFGTQFLSRIFHSTIRADLYPTKSDRVKRLETIDSITDAILRVGVVVIAGIMIISELGVNTTPIIASAGVLGIALGFGAQSLIKDLTSGIFIIIDNQYRVGDIVKLDKIAGRVEAITIRTTVLRALDGTLYHVPNGSIAATANMTMSYGGIEEDITFDRDVDISKLTLLINRVGKNLARDPWFATKILEPPRFERIVGFTPNGIEVKIVGTTTPNDSWEVRGEFYKRLLTELRSSNIQIPTAQITVHEAKKKVSRTAKA
ncbi:MAG: mechanosensitive ion channel family protein [Candidatus Saccharimonadales bacterium]